MLQREFNNGAVIEQSPYTYAGCAPNVVLVPYFVVPSTVNAGDVVDFDASRSGSTLVVPNSGYVWSFGDGAGAVGPTARHTYSGAGTYRVTLTVTDRGGNVRTLARSITVPGKSVQAPPPPPPPSKHTSHRLSARLRLIPESLHAALRDGVAAFITANQVANGIATVSISSTAATRAGIAHGPGPTVVIGRGTVEGVKAGRITLRLLLPQTVTQQLARLQHVTLTLRLVLVAGSGTHVAVNASGRY